MSKFFQVYISAVSAPDDRPKVDPWFTGESTSLPLFPPGFIQTPIQPTFAELRFNIYATEKTKNNLLSHTNEQTQKKKQQQHKK